MNRVHIKFVDKNMPDFIQNEVYAISTNKEVVTIAYKVSYGNEYFHCTLPEIECMIIN